MSKVTCRPTSVAASGGLALTGGANAAACTNDNSITTYIGASGTNGWCWLQITDQTIPAGALVRSAQVRSSFRPANTSNKPGRMVAKLALGTGSYPSSGPSSPLATVDAQSSSSTFPTAGTSNGAGQVAAWPQAYQSDQAAVNAVVLWCRTDPQTWGSAYGSVVADLWVDLIFALRPTVSDLSGPTGTIGVTSATFGWTHQQADADGGPQDAWQAQVLASGVPVVDSGEQLGGASSWTATGLPGGALTWRVRTAQTVNGTTHWSAWTTGAGFTVSTTTSEVSTVVATPVPSSGRVDVVVSRNTGTDAWSTVEVERSADAGASWSSVSPIPTPGANSVTVPDYYAPPGSVTYRARAIKTGPVSGAWVTASAVTVDVDRLVIRDATNPAVEWLSTGSVTQVPVEEREVPGSVFRAIGRSDAVVVDDGVAQWREGEFSIECATQAERDELDAVVADGREVLAIFPTVFGGIRRIKVRSIRYAGVDRVASPFRDVAIRYQRLAD